MKNILITGGNGFIGSHLAEALCGLGDNVFILDNRFRNWPVHFSVHQINSDLSDPDFIGIPFTGIIHLAGVTRVADGQRDPIKCLEVNLLGTARVLQYAKNSESRPWVILGSTIEPSDNAYGLSKRFAEEYARYCNSRYDIRLCCVRFSSVYGSLRDNPEKLIPRLISTAIAGGEMIIDNGAKVFDFVHISDIVDALLRAKAKLESSSFNFPEPIPLCSGRETTLRSLVQLVNESVSTSGIRILTDDRCENAPTSSLAAKTWLQFEAKMSIEIGIRALITEALLTNKSTS
jgi:nucleoside-diphosphate-sugar epimerase